MLTFVYILKGSNGRHYIGMTGDLERRLEQHRSGHTYTTRRLGSSIELVASRRFESRQEAAEVERRLKSWKNPAKAIEFLHSK